MSKILIFFILTVVFGVIAIWLYTYNIFHNETPVDIMYPIVCTVLQWSFIYLLYRENK